MNSFIPWVGGKSKLLWIINKMAPDHYSRFIDVFGGSGTVTMSRPIQQGCMEVYLKGKEITSAGHLSAQNFSFGEEIIELDGKLNFYLQADFDVDAAFGTWKNIP